MTQPHPAFRSIVLLAFVLRSVPRTVRLLPANAQTATSNTLQPCTSCTLWFAHDGIDARCPRCETWQYPFAREAAAKEARLKPMRSARDRRALQSEAWRGGLRAGAAALVGMTAMQMDEEEIV